MARKYERSRSLFQGMILLRSEGEESDRMRFRLPMATSYGVCLILQACLILELMFFEGESREIYGSYLETGFGSRRNTIKFR